MADDDTPIEQAIAAWHDIVPPNLPARRMAAQLAETIAGYLALRAPPALEDDPQDFAAMLAALRDDPAGGAA